jgi:hypothetical protein
MGFSYFFSLICSQKYHCTNAFDFGKLPVACHLQRLCHKRSIETAFEIGKQKGEETPIVGSPQRFYRDS